MSCDGNYIMDNYSNKNEIIKVSSTITTSTERTKKYRNRLKEDNNTTEHKVMYSLLSAEERQQKNNKRRLEKLTEYQICSIGERNKQNYKKNKRISTLDNSYKSSLIIKWDYENPCEL